MQNFEDQIIDYDEKPNVDIINDEISNCDNTQSVEGEIDTAVNEESVQCVMPVIHLHKV